MTATIRALPYLATVINREFALFFFPTDVSTYSSSPTQVIGINVCRPEFDLILFKRRRASRPLLSAAK